MTRLGAMHTQARKKIASKSECVPAGPAHVLALLDVCVRPGEALAQLLILLRKAGHVSFEALNLRVACVSLQAHRFDCLPTFGELSIEFLPSRLRDTDLVLQSSDALLQVVHFLDRVGLRSQMAGKKGTLQKHRQNVNVKPNRLKVCVKFEDIP